MVTQLAVPVVQAPMAGGPSTPQLARAVGDAGGLGFLAAGYKTADALSADLDAAGDAPVGVNLFAPVAGPADPQRIADHARRLGIEPGAPRFDDDAFDAKAALVLARRPAVVSFTFGSPPGALVQALQAAGTAVWVTVTTPAEAAEAAAVGADALVAQGAEAGGHRGGFRDEEDAPEPLALLVLLQLIAAQGLRVPVVAAGGIASAAATRAALALGADAVAAGTAFLACREAGTSAVHRSQVGTDRPTGLTRAWSGRLARGIENDFQRAHTAGAPAAYPEVHHLTGPLRAEARAAGDAERVNLWAGQAHPLARHDVAAADVVRALTP